MPTWFYVGSLVLMAGTLFLFLVGVQFSTLEEAAHLVNALLRSAGR